VLPVLDSDARAEAHRRARDVSRRRATSLGHGALDAIATGTYRNGAGDLVDWSAAVRAAVTTKVSLPPDADLPAPPLGPSSRPTRVQVANETTLGAERSAEFLRVRIHRVLALARAFGYRTLVLGAWGCGAFGNDPRRTAEDFRAALEGPFAQTFDEVVFAVTDWSPERRFLGPFRDAFAA
jgi:hypothetical protein